MKRMKKLLSFLGVLAIAGALAPMAHADFVIAYSLNGGAVQPCADSVSDDVASCFAAGQNIGAGVTLTNVSGSSNSPGNANFSDQFGSTTTITTTTTGATVVIYFAAQNFNMPITGGSVTGIDYASNLSITTAEPHSSGTVTLKSCVDQSNHTVPAPVGTGFCTTPAAMALNATLTIPATLGSSQSNTVTSIFSPLGSPYSLSQMVTLVLGANTSLNLSTSQDLTPVPEPMSIALLGGVIALTARAFRRRQKTGVAV
jgi:hypothetical protein